MKKDFLTIAVLFLVIIFVALWFSSTPSYVPYSASIFRNYSKFEGFSTRFGQEYSSASDNSAIDGPVTNYLISQSTGPKAVAGFGGLGIFKSPDIASDEKLDIYSQAKGSLDSEGYGYYNSRGPLVLTPEMKNQLQTRGGNTTGSSSSVGGSPV
jgi:hypothetical protein